MTLRLYRTAVLAALVVLAMLAPARGQQRELPPQIVAAGTLGGPEQAQIDDFVRENVALLASEDPAQVKRGRQALLAPLEDRQATVVFRTHYSQQLVPELSRLAGGPTELHAINALVVAGPLATKPAADLAVKYLADPRVAVRYAAAAALRDTFEALEQASPAIVPIDATNLVDRLSSGLTTEADARVFDVQVRALGAAAAMQRGNFESVATQALRGLAERGAERLQKLSTKPDGDEFVTSLVRAGGILRDAVGAANNRVDADLAKRIAGFGGHLWGWVYRGISNGDNPPAKQGTDPAIAARRSLASTAVLTAHNAMYFGAQRIQPNTQDSVQGAELAKSVAEASAAGDGRFLQGSRQIFGAGGFMTSSPLSFPPNQFIK